MGIDEIVAARKAVFLDRDGVINNLVFNPATDAWESPHQPHDLVFCPDVFQPLKDLIKAGFKLFIVSNQPSYAKNKTTLEAIKEIAENCISGLQQQHVHIEESYYCYHHPSGVIPEYTQKCPCRKPEPFFLLQAQQKHHLSLKESWMIGDRDSDIECGRRAGCKTVLIDNPHSMYHQGREKPDFTAKNLRDAVKQILEK